MRPVNVYIVMVSTWRKVRINDIESFNELTGSAPVFVSFDKEEADEFCKRENELIKSELMWSVEKAPVRGTLGLGDSLAAMATGWAKEYINA